MAIHENSTVKVIGGFYDGKTGKVATIYPSLDVAIVSFDDTGNVGKVSLSALVEVRSQEKQIPENGKKISRADFDAALIEVTTNSMSTSGNFAGAMSGVIIGEFIGSEIFKESDVVVITEDQFIAALWAGCSPEAVNKTVGNEMPICKALHVGIAAVITLRKLSEILFGAENG